MTQEEKILNHLLANESITSWEAIKKYGCTRLSARIFELRKKGYNISTKRKTSINKYNELVSYGVYVLNGGKENE